jgi:hypothetical protein
LNEPDILNDPDILNPSLGDATFPMASGETVNARLRIVYPNKTDNITFNVTPQTVTAAVIAHDVDSTDAAAGITQPSLATTQFTIITTSLPLATVGSSYSRILQASGATGSVTWSFTTGSLPSGLTLNTSTGEISGTPVTSGAASFTVRAQDSGQHVATRNLTLSVASTSGTPSLFFANEPTNAPVSSVMLPAVSVTAVDATSNPLSNVTITLSANPPVPLSGNTATTGASGIAIFPALSVSTTGTFTLTASAPTLTSATGPAVTISNPVGVASVTIETKADGTGSLVSAQTVTAGNSLTVYAIGRDSSAHFLANVSATWSLTSITGGVVATDLAGCGKTWHSRRKFT